MLHNPHAGLVSIVLLNVEFMIESGIFVIITVICMLLGTIRDCLDPQ